MSSGIAKESYCGYSWTFCQLIKREHKDEERMWVMWRPRTFKKSPRNETCTHGLGFIQRSIQGSRLYVKKIGLHGYLC